MEIVFLRHGQTDLNKAASLQGSEVNQSLNEVGWAYAEKVARKFDPSGFAAVYSSPLKRALETAQIFVKGQKEIKIDRRLLEIDFGEWDGQPLAEIKRTYPETLDPWGKVDRSYTKYAPHGESFAELEQRCSEFLNEMAQKYPEQKILVVCHGTLIRMMMAHYFTQGAMINFETIDNCALTKISYRQHIPRLIYYNRVLV